MEMETKEIFTEINNAITELEQQFSLFAEDEINMAPFEGSWTPAQLMEHINLALPGSISLLFGPVKDTDRQFDLHVQLLRDMFLNFDTKMQAPVSVKPPEKNYKKEELLFTLDKLKTKLSQFDTSSDMTKTCTAGEFPTLGYLTRIEIAYFTLYHTQRHVNQLKNIYKSLIIK